MPTPALTITQSASTTGGPRPAGDLHRHHHQHRPDPLYRRGGDGLLRPDVRLRRLRRRVGQLRDGDLRGPGADLDRGPGPRQPPRSSPTPSRSNTPDTGDKLVITTAASAAAGSTCPPGTTTSPCQLTVPVLTPGLTITSAATPVTATPGAAVTYTLTVTDTGQTSYTGATVTDPLTGVLDDAAYNGDATTATVHRHRHQRGHRDLHRPGPDLDREPEPRRHRHHHLLGHRAPPDTGNHILASTLTSAYGRQQLPRPESTDPRCATTVPVSESTITTTANVATTVPGGVVAYTTTLTNTGADPDDGITLTAGGTQGNDGSSNGDETASSGTLSVSATGAVVDRGHPGRRYRHPHRVVHRQQPRHRRPPADRERHLQHPGQQLPHRQHRPPISTSIPVLTPGLSITQTASTTAAVPGQQVTFTVTITDTGQTLGYRRGGDGLLRPDVR